MTRDPFPEGVTDGRYRHKKDFFSTLYKNTSGALIIIYLGDGGMPVTKWFAADQYEEMAAYA